ncbi:unnamed protein product [Prorocentrum cordatum]|uniref:ShKT domain-containing protein n=1 Tax=Prorocentrum cordatum TaxID=2364126 RepID=A0ABN9UJQ4_9DINO|nr:unnamed protein product [Polarella glacialis]
MPMTSSVGIAAQRAPWTVYSVVLLVHSIPTAISVQVQTMDELEMMQGSNISAAIPLSSATSSATVPCAPFNDDTCLHHLYWGSGYSCATATEWCHSWGKDMQRCCSLACGTAYLTEKACNEMVSAGTCAYPHSGSSACDTTGELSSPEGALGAASYPTPSPGLVQGGYGGAPAATPSPTELTLGGYSGGFGGYPVAAPAATPSPTEPPTLGGYPGGFGGYGGAPAATPSPTEPSTLGGYPGGFGGDRRAPIVHLHRSVQLGVSMAPCQVTHRRRHRRRPARTPHRRRSSRGVDTARRSPAPAPPPSGPPRPRPCPPRAPPRPCPPRATRTCATSTARSSSRQANTF